ncbi:ABC transporter permease [Microbacterium paulum]|uniref:ABC transporter permease n=1 Tax=Microbacterium paulum TaxID=2707006 RepID=UPI003084074C
MDTTDRFARLAREPFIVIDDTGVRSTQTGGKIREILRHRELLGLLVRRDLQARYRDSFLGFLWTVIRPIVQFLMYYIVLGQFLRAAQGIDQFAIYLFSGLTLFAFFSDMVFGSTGSIVGNAGLIKKIYLPREIFPLAAIGGAGFMFLIQLAILFFAAVIFRALPEPSQLLWFFPSVLLVAVWGLAIGLFLAAANVYLRDIQYLTEVIMMLAMWASPIVYSWSMVTDAISRLGLPAWTIEIYTANPITLGVLGFHRAFWGPGGAGDYPDHLALRMLIAGVIGLVLLIGAQRVFTRLQGNFAQEL